MDGLYDIFRFIFDVADTIRTILIHKPEIETIVAVNPTAATPADPAPVPDGEEAAEGDEAEGEAGLSAGSEPEPAQETAPLKAAARPAAANETLYLFAPGAAGGVASAAAIVALIAQNGKTGFPLPILIAILVLACVVSAGVGALTGALLAGISESTYRAPGEPPSQVMRAWASFMGGLAGGLPGAGVALFMVVTAVGGT